MLQFEFCGKLGMTKSLRMLVLWWTRLSKRLQCCLGGGCLVECLFQFVYSTNDVGIQSCVLRGFLGVHNGGISGVFSGGACCSV